MTSNYNPTEKNSLFNQVSDASEVVEVTRPGWFFIDGCTGFRYFFDFCKLVCCIIFIFLIRF